jgi:tol-pal system protein YbgF
VVAAACAVAAAGCTTRADLDTLNGNELTLREMIASDRQQIAALDQSNKQLQDQIEQLKHGGGGAAPASSADKSPAYEDRLGKLEASVSALQVTAPTAAANPAATASAKTEPGESTAEEAAPAASTWQTDLDTAIQDAANSSAPGVKIYREGLDAMKDGKYPVAIGKFALLQKRYPKSELSEPAEYFSANALYESGKYDQSILQFNDLVMRFPKGNYASASMLREAQAFVQLNDKIDARLTLQKLLADHGDAPEATAANTMMKGLETP